MCRRIPENPQEDSEVEGGDLWMEVSFEEVGDVPSFDSLGFQAMSGASLPLLAQFNESRRNDSPIGRFLGFFRILESCSYGTGDRRTLRPGTSRRIRSSEPSLRKQPRTGTSPLLWPTWCGPGHACAHLKDRRRFRLHASGPKAPR